jgi:cobalt transporter subunit CbtB
MIGSVARPIGQTRALLVAAALGLIALYLVGLDQGHLLSLVQGSLAFDQNLIHEALHDARHAFGFPCH